ncbi:MAG: T9SS type A sorting domain-containing protein [bacterium]
MKQLLNLTVAIYSCALILLQQSNTFAQTAPEIQWQRRFGGTVDQRGLSIAEGDKLDGNYIFAGYTNSNDGDVDGYHGPNSGVLHTGDAWIGSADEFHLNWQKCLGGSDVESANCIIRTRDGNYVVTGWTWSHDGDFIDNHGKGNAWTAKFDYRGNIIWMKCFGGSQFETANCIIETNEEGNDLMMVGQTSSTDWDCSGNVSKGENDIWVVRMSSDGKIRWQKNFGGPSNEYATAVKQTPDLGFIIAGTTSQNGGDVSGCHVGNDDAWIIKLDRNGALQWQKCLGGTGEEIANSIAQTSDGGYLIVGETNSTDGDVTGLHQSLFYSDAWIAKISPTGELQWQKCFGGYNNDNAQSIIPITGGDYIIAGNAGSNNGDFSRSSGHDAWLTRISDSGVVKWQVFYGGNAYSIINTSDGGYAFTGSVTDSLHGYPGYVSIVKLFPDTGKASVEAGYSSDFAKDYIHVFPNPSSSEVNFSVASNLSLLTVGFYDVMGRQYYTSYSLENNSLACTVHDLPPGIYLARIGWVGRVYWQKQDYPGAFTVPFVVSH